MYYYNELERIHTEMKQRRESLAEELADLPDGYLYIYRGKDNRQYYYQRIPKGGNRKKEKRLGINKDPNALHGLIRKQYVMKSIDAIDSNLKAVDLLMSSYIPADELSVMKSFISEHPSKANFIYKHPSESPIASAGDPTSADSSNSQSVNWAKNYKRADNLYSDNLKSTSSDGVDMRSMGEIAIASRLDYYKIPYRYEARLEIPELEYVPDFTIKRPRDGRIVYWEHFGMVSNKDYMAHNMTKLIRYEEYGIVPWRNLIISYGRENGGIDLRLADALIKAWLV